MLENLNTSLFLAINATPMTPMWLRALATFIAKDLILIVPLMGAFFWLWGNPERRVLVIKVALAIVCGLVLSWCIGKLYPHDRPFVSGIGYHFLEHKANNSFPSNHATIIFSFALGFLFWYRLSLGAVLLVIGAAIAWSRVFLGVHWPLDMVGGFLVALLACVLAQLIWTQTGDRLYTLTEKIYGTLFSGLIRRGWVRQ